MISIIIPTYNHCIDLLRPCIESIARYTNLEDVEVIIVANGCTDETEQYVKKLNGPFKVIWEEQKLGYTKATNIGLLAAKGHKIVFLNNDVVLLSQERNQWIETLKKPLEDNTVGLSGIHRMYSDETKSYFFCFYCVMLKREVFERLGLLDETFGPGFGEDIDYCKKIEQLGYKLADCETNTTYKGNLMMGDFPIYHPGTSTFHDAEHGGYYEEIVQRNLATLKNRYTKKYSIIIPFRGCAKDIEPCIKSICEYTDLSRVEVLIIANGCPIETKTYFESLGSPFEIIWIDDPIGFIEAVNLRLIDSKGEYVILLNGDVELLPQNKNMWIDMLEAPFANDKVGITGPHAIKCPIINERYLMFFCVMIKRRVIDAVGLLDKRYGVGVMDDLDYCLRAKKVGFEIAQVPTEDALEKHLVTPVALCDTGSFPILHLSEVTMFKISQMKKNMHTLLDIHFSEEVVHIIVPTYKRYTLLKEALNSILNQTYKKIRVYVVSDGPDEQVRKIVDEFNHHETEGKDEFNYVQFEYLYLEKHEGALGGKCRILGIDALPESGYCCFLDDDNILYPEYAEKLYQALDRGRRDISYCQIKHSHIDHPIPISAGPFQYAAVDSLNYMVSNRIAKKCKDRWVHDPDNPKICHDYDFIDECSKHTNSNFVPEILAEHRRTESRYTEELLLESLKQQDRNTYEDIFIANTYGVNSEELKDCVVLDIGANRGIFSIFSMLHGAKESYAFEPNPISYQSLAENVKGFNVSISNLAVTKPGLKRAYLAREGVECQVHEEGVGESVNCVSLEELLENIPTSDNMVLKLDCEGSEYDIIFNSPKEIIRRFKYIYCEAHNNIHPNKNYNYILLEEFVKNIGFVAERPQIPSYLVHGIWYYDESGNVSSFVPSTVPEVPNNRILKFTRIESATRRVYDCFPFFNELDLLEIRLNELNDVVTYFVLVEATKTHSGNNKPLYFEENKQRFSKFLHKIRHIIVDLPETNDPWVRERFQRESLLQGLNDCQDGDIVIASDLDEIPRREVIQKYETHQGIMGLELNYSFYYLNCVRQDKGTTHARIMPYRAIKDIQRNDPMPLCLVRYTKCPMIKNGGWHFSFVGGVDNIIKKLQSYAHQEYNNDFYVDVSRIQDFLEEGGDMLQKNMDFQFVTFDESFPQYVFRNLNRFIEKGYVKCFANNKNLLPREI